MFAIVETGGKQYKVTPGDKIKVEKLEGDVGKKVHLENVLAISKEDNEVVAGKPYIKGASVTAEILKQAKDAKVVVFRYKPKKRVRVKTGHRQHYTLVKIDKINIKEKKEAKTKSEEKE